MSSKAQYKDALKRQKQIISELTRNNEKLIKELKLVNTEVELLRGLTPIKKWWQFWK